MENEKINKTITLSAEEISRIMELPERTFLIGGIQRRGLFDASESRFYLLKDDGTLDGRSAIVKQSAPVEEASEQNEPDERESDEDEDEEDDESEADRPRSSKVKKLLFVVVSVLVIAVAGVLFIVPQFIGHGNQDSPDPSQGQQVSNPAPIDEIQVVQVVSDLIPGDVITESNIKCSTISKETFSTITLGGTGLYQWRSKDSLLDQYVTKYIPAGQFLAYENVAAVYNASPNPWVNEQAGKVYVSIPLGELEIDDSFNYGSVFDMTIQKQTVSETPNDTTGEVDPLTVPGLDHEKSVQQSLVVDTFKLSNLIICDLENGGGKSIYTLYKSFAGIPVGEQPTYIRRALANDTGLIEALSPAAIRIKITQEQADALGDLTKSGVTITITKRPDLDATTAEKADFSGVSRAMKKTIDDALAYNAKLEGEE